MIVRRAANEMIILEWLVGVEDFNILRGMRNEISISKIKNIMITIKKFVEKDGFFVVIGENPHSNLSFFAFKFSRFSIRKAKVFNRIVIIKILMRIRIKVKKSFERFIYYNKVRLLKSLNNKSKGDRLNEVVLFP